MTDHTDAQLRRIRGLLAKAEGTTNPHEADAFSAKAFELMERYRIDLATVRGNTEPDMVRSPYPLAAKAKYLRPSLNLLGVVAEHYGVVILVPSTGNSRTPTLVGDADDILATVLMFESLVIQRDRAILAADVPIGLNVNRYRSSAAYGFAVTIHRRLEAIREARAASATTGTELALVDRLQQVLNQLDNPTQRNVNTPNLDGAGVATGVDAGNRADLGQDRLDATSGPRALGA